MMTNHKTNSETDMADALESLLSPEGRKQSQQNEINYRVGISHGLELARQIMINYPVSSDFQSALNSACDDAIQSRYAAADPVKQ
jgi:hypothetical protein